MNSLFKKTTGIALVLFLLIGSLSGCTELLSQWEAALLGNPTAPTEAPTVPPCAECSFGQWTQVTAPTVNTKGQDKRTCPTCGNFETRTTLISGMDGKIMVSSPLPADYFKDKTIACIGDSITYGYGLGNRANSYVHVMGDILDARIINLGVNSTGYCESGAVSHMKQNANLTAEKIKDADIITIALGVNDWDWAVKDGIYRNKQKFDAGIDLYGLGDPSSTDPTTFYGALRSWCEKIAELKKLPGYENKQFIFITPIITSWNASITTSTNWDQSKKNIHGHILRDYCEAIMDVAAEYGHLVFDANTFSGLYYNSADDNNVVKDQLEGDGVHISKEGHAIYGQSLAEFLLNGYTYEDRSAN